METNEMYINILKWLAIGLAVSFGLGYVLYLNVETLMKVSLSTILFLPAIIQIILAMVFSAALPKINVTTAKILYLVYCGLTGINFMFYFLIYNLSSIMYVFLITSIVFGLMAYWGKNTKKDLNELGTYLMVALLGIVIITILNLLFFHLTSLDFILCVVGIVVFILFIAYDMKKAINYAIFYPETGEIYGAFQLYLDFINLFVRLLRLFGKSRRD